MKLIIDIGNTRTKVALFEGKDIVLSSDFDICSLQAINDFVKSKNVSSTIICTVKLMDSEILSIIDHYDALVFSEETPIPVTNKYKTPSTLGKDRLALVVGAYAVYPNQDILVFDAGTCLTMDFINKKGEYIGGRISPGINMRYRALHNFTDNLPLITQEKTVEFIGSDTRSSIISGVQQGVLAEIRSMISEYSSKKSDIVFIITGGDCFFFEKELKNTIFAKPNLILYGLNEILDFNV